MIRDLSNAEKEINDFMKVCREWLEAGKPTSSIFRKNRAICESLEFFLGGGGRPVSKMEGYGRCWMNVREVKALLTQRFAELALETVYPFNHPIITGSGRRGPDDHYFLEVHTAKVWENEDRVSFVMNFKPLKEKDDE